MKGVIKIEENQNASANTNKNTGLIIVIVILLLIIIAGSVYGYITINDLKNEDNKPAGEANTVVDDDRKDEENTVNNTTNKKTTNNTNSTNTTKTNSSNENTASTKESTTTSSKDAKESTKENPLKLGEWGLAAKYVSKNLSTEYADTNYTDVPVRVTNVTRGDEATEIVKKWFDNQSFYKYDDPKANMEWAVVDYEVDLSGLTFDDETIGTSTEVSSSVKGLDGSSIKYNEITYIISTTNTSSREYVKKPGVYKCQFIVTLPEGCTDYLIILGSSYNGAESYFIGEQ